MISPRTPGSPAPAAMLRPYSATGSSPSDPEPGPRASRRSAAETRGVLLVFLQVALVAVIMITGGLETSALRRVVAFASVGFFVHHFLPFRLRLPLFALMSVTALALVLGGVPGQRLPDFSLGFARAGTILAIGAGLIALCHLPLAFWQRAVLLGLAGAGIAVFRSGYAGTGEFAIVWPVLAAMFMFRTIVYLYEISTAPGGVAPSRSAGYFFLLPNSSALLFPVVDFRAFRQRYYDEPALQIYQRGAKWMTRGIVQLLLYHFVNLTFAITATEVANGADLIRYVVTNVFHYVKISGEFHLLIGLLLLFGFNLPETNRRYFLAASFTDYWRRVNIYWRDFMMRVFYYPAFFRLKKLGETRALVLATAWVFFITWALHLYQAWWVTGSAEVTWTDSLFWTALAVLVLASALWELKRGRKRRLASSGFSARETAGVATKTAATFAVITILWSFWSAPSVDQWLHIWSLADWNTLAWGAVVLAAIMVATLVFEVLPAWRRASVVQRAGVARAADFRRDAWQGVACLGALCLGIQGLLRLPADTALPAPVADARSMLHILRRHNPPGEARGYYERLTNVNPGNRQYWEAVQLRTFPFHYAGEHPVRNIPEPPFQEPLPNVHLRAYDTDYQTNRWGLRGRDCEQEPAPGTLRIAVLGSSHVMGWGLPVEETFASALETRLNREHGDRAHFEVLNFAVAGYGPVLQVALVKGRVAMFRPHVVIHVAHLNDYDWTNRDIARCVRAGVRSPVPTADAILREARVNAHTHALMATDRLRRHEPALLRATYDELVRACRAIGAVPVCVLLPLPRDDPAARAPRDRLLATARDAGFGTIDLSNTYAGLQPEELEIDEPGRHSNARAHGLVAEALHRQLKNDLHELALNGARRVAAIPRIGTDSAITPTAESRRILSMSPSTGVSSVDTHASP